MIDIEGPFEAYRGSSYRRKDAARYKNDMVWLYRSPTPVGRMGDNLLVQMIFPAFAKPKVGGGGEGGQHPVESGPGSSYEQDKTSNFGFTQRK
jgi:hypothetical protein